MKAEAAPPVFGVLTPGAQHPGDVSLVVFQGGKRSWQPQHKTAPNVYVGQNSFRTTLRQRLQQFLTRHFWKATAMTTAVAAPIVQPQTISEQQLRRRLAE